MINDILANVRMSELNEKKNPTMMFGKLDSDWAHTARINAKVLK